jgi:hypothetical protein
MHYDYKPMHQTPLATEEQIAAMHARLAQRGRNPIAPSQPPEVARSPKEKSELEWNKPTSAIDIAVKTKCGMYSCCKVTVNGKPHYELWKLAPGGGWYGRIDKGSGLDNFLQARELARQDWEKHA